MRTRSKKAAEMAHFGGNSVSNESQTEAEHSVQSFPSPSELKEPQTITKVENYNERNRDLVANIVKSEVLKFHNNEAEEIFYQKDMITVLLERIPKTETEILGDEYKPPSSSYEVDDPFKHDTFRDCDLNLDPDPEIDPFADVDCDPSFSQLPPSRSSKDSVIATQVQLRNASRVKASSNPTSSAKRSLPTATTSQYDRMRVTVDSKFRCQLCLELRYSTTWLETHLETCAASHKDRHRFCVPCNTLFLSAVGRRQHSLRIHGTIVPKLKKVKLERVKVNPYPFKCQFCSCAFALREPLVAHLTSHLEVNTIDEEDLKQRPYRCQDCPLTFRHYSVYTLHIMLHKNEREFNCPMPNCEKAFNTKFHLKIHHRNIHSKEKPFKCPKLNCGKTFKTNGQLQNHVVCHSNDKPFQCPHSDCNSAFKNRDSLRKHLLLHSEASYLKRKAAKLYKCSERGCYAAYKMKGTLQTHIKKKHKE